MIFISKMNKNFNKINRIFETYCYSEFEMTEYQDIKEKNLKEIDNICEECKEEDESVLQNLILTGFKICKSCRVSKTIFPI